MTLSLQLRVYSGISHALGQWLLCVKLTMIRSFDRVFGPGMRTSCSGIQMPRLAPTDILQSEAMISNY
jgi:hypothetical protein